MDVKQVNAFELREVRFSVLWPQLSGPSQAVLEYDSSQGAIHLAAFSKNLPNQIIGVASLFLQRPSLTHFIKASDKVFRLRAMGVVESQRGKGVGRYILNSAVMICRSFGGSVIWCDAREVAWGFYEGLDFVYVDEKFIYDVPEVGPHKMMYRRI